MKNTKTSNKKKPKLHVMVFDHAKVDPSHCLTDGLFRPLKKASYKGAQPPPPINHGPSGQPKVEVEKANVPDQPKSDELSDYYVEPSRVPPRLQEPVNEEVDKNSVPYVNHPYQIPDAPEWSNTPSPW